MLEGAGFEIIAERELGFEPASDSDAPSSTVRFRLGRPVKAHSDWYCPFEVFGWGERQVVDAAHGADSVQALLLALAKLRIRLGALALEHRGRLAFDGRLGPGLPSLFESSDEDDDGAEEDEPDPTEDTGL